MRKGDGAATLARLKNEEEEEKPTSGFKRQGIEAIEAIEADERRRARQGKANITCKQKTRRGRGPVK